MFVKWDVLVFKMLVFFLKIFFICQINKINFILIKLNCYIMDILKLYGQVIILVDQVEDNLFIYFRIKDLWVGDVIFNEMELVVVLGVVCSVLREVFS